MKRDKPFLWEGVTMYVGSPEGGSTIEKVPGATIETAWEVAELLESNGLPPASPPSTAEVLAQVALLEAEKPHQEQS